MISTYCSETSIGIPRGCYWIWRLFFFFTVGFHWTRRCTRYLYVKSRFIFPNKVSPTLRIILFPRRYVHRQKTCIDCRRWTAFANFTARKPLQQSFVFHKTRRRPIHKIPAQCLPFHFGRLNHSTAGRGRNERKERTGRGAPTTTIPSRRYVNY